jgi:hypothetical protein
VKLMCGLCRWSWNVTTCLDSLPPLPAENGSEGSLPWSVLKRTTDPMRNVFLEKWPSMKVVLVAGAVLSAMIRLA